MMDAIKTKIGKDVIESLTLGMYDDSRFIYREYIQNSSDQIDIAVENNILQSKDDGYIGIDINKSKSIITIQDNATGISSNKVEEILKNIAYSPKDIFKHRGFRGIGRLGGLGYCETLKFETSSLGESKISTLIWDANKLKQLIHNRQEKQEAAYVIDAVTTYQLTDGKAEDHYFKVTLEGVENKILLDTQEISEYLSMVAPVLYDKGFIYSSGIKYKSKELSVPIDEYRIYINTDQIYKLYTSRIYEGGPNERKSFDEITDIQYFYIRTPTDNELIAWGWYGISNFKKQIPGRANPARGIRLRKGNIQIGSEYCLVKLFHEPRGNFYFFGEVHAVHDNLIPNARRDYFEDNETLRILEGQLRDLFHMELEKLYRFSSHVRNTTKRISELEDFKIQIKDKQNKGFTDKEEEANYKQQLEDKKEIAAKAEKELERIKDKFDIDSPEKKIFDKIISGLPDKKPEDIETEDNNENSTKYLTADLNQLTRKERKLVSKIFGIIDNVLTPELSMNLKEKIKEEFK